MLSCMCGRATLATPREILRALYQLEQIELEGPRYNIAPSQALPVIRVPHKLEAIKWGLASAGRGRGINVRAETVARAPMYRDSFRKRRCLVIVDGFFEWRRGAGKKKQPYLIRRADAQPFALAGLWDRTADGAESCAIITGAAQGVVAPLHDRMPVIVPQEGIARWLDASERNPSDLLAPSAAELVSHPVSMAVNNPAADDASLIEPLERDAAGEENLPLFDER